MATPASSAIDTTAKAPAMSVGPVIERATFPRMRAAPARISRPDPHRLRLYGRISRNTAVYESGSPPSTNRATSVAPNPATTTHSGWDRRHHSGRHQGERQRHRPPGQFRPQHLLRARRPGPAGRSARNRARPVAARRGDAARSTRRHGTSSHSDRRSAQSTTVSEGHRALPARPTRSCTSPEALQRQAALVVGPHRGLGQPPLALIRTSAGRGRTAWRCRRPGRRPPGAPSHAPSWSPQ